ncbi:MAG: 50S ribosomal protein L18 [Candidatus Pacearchaeota archaeon]|jgi:large subunit ribosomal protein L18
MKIDYKRKRKGKTDYKARMGMLKSGLPRVVIRKTNKFIYVQYVKSVEARDKAIFTVSSRDLLEKGWAKESKGSLKSVSAAYLTGYLAGKEIISKDKKGKVILDIGLERNVAGSRLYGALKGLVDAGVNISYDEKAFPKKERLEGKHLKKDAQVLMNKVKENIK